MTAAVCLDNRDGILFNNRRQSRDKELIRDLARLAGGKPILMSPYSEPLFSEIGCAVSVSEDFLSRAASDDICFVEKDALLPHADRISSVVIYRWNRDYPSDKKFDLDLSALGFSLSETAEFAGSSHEKITRELYIK